HARAPYHRDVPNLPFDFQQPFTQAASTPLSVAALSRKIEAALDQGLPMSVQVVGEVANHTVRNGHHYWSLRDDNARIDCVMWASDARAASVHAQDGARMVAPGRVVH
ncbi:MAG: exodeoxyribonuclease VII large subunit, partial [Phycisphaerales bacterium]|nr:exodeoxyribonuclease VII large subunit [Phycisphaerales bacterium]